MGNIWDKMTGASNPAPVRMNNGASSPRINAPRTNGFRPNNVEAQTRRNNRAKYPLEEVVVVPANPQQGGKRKTKKSKKSRKHRTRKH